MQFNCIISRCVACSKTRRLKDKNELIDEIAELILGRTQLSATGVASGTQEDFDQRAIAHDDLTDFFLELEESCYICKSHRGNLAMVAHDVEKLLCARIEKRKKVNVDIDDSIKPKKESTGFKVIALRQPQENSELETGPYKK